MNSMRGCGCCRMSGWDRRWDLVVVVVVLDSKDGGRGESCGWTKAGRPNPAKLNSPHKRHKWVIRITFLSRLYILRKYAITHLRHVTHNVSPVTTRRARGTLVHVIIFLPLPAPPTKWMAAASATAPSLAHLR